MKSISLKQMAKQLTVYRIAVLLSSLSAFFGIFRELLIVKLLGFTSTNDLLQLYLSIFYTVSLAIDALRLACLNLYSILSLERLLLTASALALPFSILVAVALSYTVQNLNPSLLLICILGSYLHLMATLLITYLQRHNLFLIAQFINIMPNFILIPGILICYWFLKTELVAAIICLTSLVPVLQCLILFFLARRQSSSAQNTLPFFKGILTFLRHFSAIVGESLFQVLIRKAFYANGTGYLSVYAMTIRIYAAIRFILIDSFIGSKLALWKKEAAQDSRYFVKIFHSITLAIFAVCFTLMISLQAHPNLIYASLQIIMILIFGFYLSTVVRVIYFKINHHENNSTLVTQFAMYELLCALCAFLLTKLFNYPMLAILWLGYIAKPFAQLLLLRTKYDKLEAA